MTARRWPTIRADWAERTLDVHVADMGVCAHCMVKHGERRPWPCWYARIALKKIGKTEGES